MADCEGMHLINLQRKCLTLSGSSVTFTARMGITWVDWRAAVAPPIPVTLVRSSTTPATARADRPIVPRDKRCVDLFLRLFTIRTALVILGLV